MFCRHRTAPLSADCPEPEPELQPQIAAWARLTRGARRLARLRRLWATLGHFLRVVKLRGCEGFTATPNA